MSSKSGSESDQLRASLEIPFANVRHARIALKTLEVDQEPRRELITKRLSLIEGSGEGGSDKDTSGPAIRVEWTAREARILRVSVNSFLDHLHLVVDTIKQFDLGDEAKIIEAN